MKTVGHEPWFFRKADSGCCVICPDLLRVTSPCVTSIYFQCLLFPQGINMQSALGFIISLAPLGSSESVPKLELYIVPGVWNPSGLFLLICRSAPCSTCRATVPAERLSGKERCSASGAPFCVRLLTSGHVLGSLYLPVSMQGLQSCCGCSVSPSSLLHVWKHALLLYTGDSSWGSFAGSFTK